MFSFSELLNPEQHITTECHIIRHTDVNVPNFNKSLSCSSYGFFGGIFDPLTNVPYLAPSSRNTTVLRFVGSSFVEIRYSFQFDSRIWSYRLLTTFIIDESFFLCFTVIVACWRLTDLSSSIVIVESFNM